MLWKATITDDCGASTRVLEAEAATYTEAYLKVLSILPSNYCPSDRTRGIIGLEAVEN